MSLRTNWVYSMSKFSISEITKNNFLDTKYDVALFFSSSDYRCDFIASNLKKGFSKNTIIFKIDDKNLSDNFSSLDATQIVELSSSDYSSIYLNLGMLFRDIDSDRNVSVFVDYSSVPKECLSIICYFLFKESSCSLNKSKLSVDFGYSIGEYTKIESLSSFSSPIILPGCEGLPLTKKNRAAVFILGFDPFGPFSIFNYLNPEKSYAVIATSDFSNEYESTVLKCNSEFINSTSNGSNGLIRLPLASVGSIYSGFRELSAPMKDYNLTFALFGPKTHTLAAILLSMSNESITCMYSRSEDEKDRVAICSGEYIVSRVVCHTEFM